jgi:hypothetical protein
VGQIDIQPVGSAVAGSAAKQFLDNAINDIGHTFAHEIVQEIVHDMAEELHPRVVFGEIAKDIGKDIEELKPSSIIRSIIFGE